MDSKVYNDRLLKFNFIFNLAFEDFYDGLTSSEDIKNYDEKMALYQLYIFSNICLVRNKIIEAKETSYDIDKRILYVNTEDEIEYVDYVILYAIIERLFKQIKYLNIKYKFVALYVIFYKLGLINVYSERILNGSEHIMISNFTKAVLASI